MYHVINRGNYRADVFETAGAKEAFEACLYEACAKAGWKLHAFVVMRNHYPLGAGDARSEPGGRDEVVAVDLCQSVQSVQERTRPRVPRPLSGDRGRGYQDLGSGRALHPPQSGQSRSGIDEDAADLSARELSVPVDEAGPAGRFGF